jgi:hypothetical protein
MGPTTGLNVLENRKITCPCRAAHTFITIPTTVYKLSLKKKRLYLQALLPECKVKFTTAVGTQRQKLRNWESNRYLLNVSLLSLLRQLSW